MAPKQKLSREKRKFYVYEVGRSGTYQFLTCSVAVSSAQARNNARWSFYGPTPFDALDEIVAVESGSEEHKRITAQLRPRRNEEKEEFARLAHPEHFPGRIVGQMSFLPHPYPS